MDTAKLKRFAAEARVNLMEGVRRKFRSLGFDENGESNAEPELIQGGTLWNGEEYPETFFHQWTALKERLKSHGVREVVEEAAYTWFNRMMAIRILSKNELCEPILATEGNVSGYPLLLESARMGQIPEMSAQERHRFDKLMEDDTMTSEQFSLLLTVWCHNNPIINSCFGSINGYVELLLPDNIIRPDGFIALLNNTSFITEEDFKSAELIGWLYQFYISERKDEVMKKQKYAADEIPAATQIFTPNWIVKYMVENTILPQVNASNEILDKAKYLVKNPDAKPSGKVELEDLKVADFACGSGHILNECFDLLFALYRDEAYSRKEAIECIFTKNLIGIDIDLRAKQLAMFALLLKACQRDASFADAHCLPRILTVPEISELVQDARGYLPHFFLGSLSADAKKELVDAWEDLKHADVLGSIIKFNISPSTRRQIVEAVQHWRNEDFISPGIQAGLPIMDFILALTDSYDAIVMNPPYMSTGKDDILKKYAVANYPDSKADLFTVFMDVAIDRLKDVGRYGMINMQSWMFLSSYESLRKRIIKEQQLESLLHLGPRTFDELSGEVVQNSAFVISKVIPSHSGIYLRLIDGKSCPDKESLFLNYSHYYSVSAQKQYEKIPGSPIAYWISSKTYDIFLKEKQMSVLARARLGQNTGDNERFLRSWFEVSYSKIGRNLDHNYDGFGKKWIPYTKGGITKKWYSSQETIINWENNGEEVKVYCTYRNGGKHWSRYIQSLDCFYKEAIVFPRIGTGNFYTRYVPKGSIFDVNAPAVFTPEYLRYQLAFLNSKVAIHFLNILCPTLTFQVGDVSKLPFKITKSTERLETLVEDCIIISKEDWDAHETSWDFEKNPLLAVDVQTYMDNIDTQIERHRQETGETLCIDPAAPQLDSLSWRYEQYCQKWDTLFMKLHANEEELNHRFIEIYGLQDELSPDVPYDEITILQQGEADKNANGTLTWYRDVVIQQLISYIVGCYMGRYRLDKPGLAIAHPNPTEDELAEYTFNINGKERFKIDSDAIIPVLPEGAPFYDNLMNYVSEFVRKVWGEDTHTENMNFIDSCLGKLLNEYLMKDFWKYHKKMYQNRPIYWEFSSKKGAFRALVYAHRMDKFTVEVLRSKYLLPYINFVEQKITNLDARQSDLCTAERRELDNLRNKTLPELREYHDRVEQVAAETAARTTVFDLDDGIIKNHALFGDIVTKLK